MSGLRPNDGVVVIWIETKDTTGIQYKYLRQAFDDKFCSAAKHCVHSHCLALYDGTPYKSHIFEYLPLLNLSQSEIEERQNDVAALLLFARMNLPPSPDECIACHLLNLLSRIDCFACQLPNAPRDPKGNCYGCKLRSRLQRCSHKQQNLHPPQEIPTDSTSVRTNRRSALHASNSPHFSFGSAPSTPGQSSGSAIRNATLTALQSGNTPSPQLGTDLTSVPSRAVAPQPLACRSLFATADSAVFQKIDQILSFCTEMRNSLTILSANVTNIDERLARIEQAEFLRPGDNRPADQDDTASNHDGHEFPVPMDDFDPIFLADNPNEVIYPSDADIDAIVQKSTSSKNFATNLMRTVFPEHDRVNKNCAGKAGKPPLSPTRLAWVKTTVLQRFPPNPPQTPEGIWRECVKAIDCANRRVTAQFQAAPAANP